MRSVNQNRHLYVISSVVTGNNNVTEGSSVGAIKAVVSGANPLEKDLYFMYKGWDGVVRSDMIPLNQITYVKHVAAADQAMKMKKVAVTLDSTINSGNAVVGQDYVLNIAFQQFYGLSPEDTYVKTVALHVTSQTSTAADFYAAMEAELNAAFAREVGATPTSNPYLTFSSDGNGVYMEEKEQPWTLGKWEVERLVFDVFPSTIIYSGEEVEWGTATSTTENTTVVPNSKKMADLEWFTFGERGDIYRGMGYPNNFEFRPMIVPTNEDGYDALEIHFAYQGTCEDIQKSEKDITLVGSAANINSLKSALGTLEVPGVPAPNNGNTQQGS